jgi:hypothetical protein
VRLPVRIAIGAVCIIVLYYLLSALTRGFMQH